MATVAGAQNGINFSVSFSPTTTYNVSYGTTRMPTPSLESKWAACYRNPIEMAVSELEYDQTHLEEEISLPPRARGHDSFHDDHAEGHAPIGLSRHSSSKEVFLQEAEARDVADVFVSSESSENMLNAD